MGDSTYRPLSKSERRDLVRKYSSWRWLEPIERYYRKRLLSDSCYRKLGRLPEWENPTRFTDKIQWMKWRGNLRRVSPLVDKAFVKEWVASEIGERHVLPILKSWTNMSSFRPEEVPGGCFLKATHASGCNLSPSDLATTPREQVVRLVSSWLRKDYELSHFEPQYRGISPCVIAERALDVNPSSPFDFKFFCFDGEVVAIQLVRYSPQKESSFYDCSWNLLSVSRNDFGEIPSKLSAPWCLQELLAHSKHLASGFPFVRIDWMVDSDNYYFGEFTFSPTNGLFRFVPDSVDYEWGELLPLRPYSSFRKRGRK